MTKENQIVAFINFSEENWNSSFLLNQKGKNVEAIFFAFLSLLDLIKANLIKNNGEETLLESKNIVDVSRGAGLELNDELLLFFEELNCFNLVVEPEENQDQKLSNIDRDNTEEVFVKIMAVRRDLKQLLAS